MGCVPLSQELSCVRELSSLTVTAPVQVPLCLDIVGAVFVNGKEMTNQLPAVTSGSTVTFDIEAVTLGTAGSNEGGSFKLRVTISSNNREVVFDWSLDQSCGSLYFGCSFFYPGWKVVVF